MKKIIAFIICFLFSLLINAQHLKKDGTPDMRYKENKATYSNTTSTSSSSTYYPDNTTTHLKKDGTPDRRYKENKVINSSTTSVSQTPVYSNSGNYSYTIKRDSKGKIIRSEKAKHEFKKQSGYPKGRPGYVIDHINPLKKGGCDCPENMQWQTIEDAKAKDKWE